MYLLKGIKNDTLKESSSIISLYIFGTSSLLIFKSFDLFAKSNLDLFLALNNLILPFE